MNKLNTNTFDILFIFLEPIECLKLSLSSHKISNILKDCNFWIKKCNEYNSPVNLLQYNINYSQLYTSFYKSCCYICKQRNFISIRDKYSYGYNLCYQCKNNTIHINAMNVDNIDKFCCIQYPFYDLTKYIMYMREQKFIFMISQINKRKLMLDSAFSKRKIEIPYDSMLCRNYILGRINMSITKIVNIICQKKYIYEYTSFLFFKKYYHSYNNSWKQSHKLALGMILKKNKYPTIYPWETI